MALIEQISFSLSLSPSPSALSDTFYEPIQYDVEWRKSLWRLHRMELRNYSICHLSKFNRLNYDVIRMFWIEPTFSTEWMLWLDSRINRSMEHLKTTNVTQSNQMEWTKRARARGSKITNIHQFMVSKIEWENVCDNNQIITHKVQLTP